MKSAFSIIGLAALCSNLLLAGSSKISSDLSKQASNARVKVIIQYNQAPTALDLAALPLVGGVVTTTLSSINAVIATLPISTIETLSANPNVVYISSDRKLNQLVDYSAAAVNADAARNIGLTGAGIGVAVIDSGIAPVKDLNDAADLLPRVVYRQSFAGGLAHTDKYGHGTHVAGIIAASGLESSCPSCTRVLKGIAPDASLIDLQVLDETGAGTDSAVISAIDQAITLKNMFHIRVINLSLGRPIYESYQLDPLCQAVEAAWKAGITVVVAAGNDGRDNSVGNDGYGTIESPGNDPYVITVGAMKAMGTYTRTDDLVASYSSKGPAGLDFVVKPDIVAPGNHVVSLEANTSALASDPLTAVPVSYYKSTADNSTSKKFMMLNGTSMATPVVSGAAADLLEGDPTLTPDQIKARLMKSAYKTFPQSSTAVDPVSGESFTSYYDIFTVGAGYLDIAAALANHDVITGNALSPLATYNPADGNVYLVFDPASTWGKINNSVQAVWGSTNVSPNRAVWGTRGVWGTSGVAGFNTIWGTRGVWGTETDQGLTTVESTRGVWGTDSHTSDSDTLFTVTPQN